MIFAIEPLSKCWDEVMVLASAHWKETEGYRHGQPFAPSFERYNQYDKLGWLLQFTGRDNGVLVAYATMYLVPSMHSQKLIAVEDTFFISESHRKGRNALTFLRYVERECASRGAVTIDLTAKVINGVDRILEYMGYTLVAKQYSKALDCGIESELKPRRQHAEPASAGAQTGP